MTTQRWALVAGSAGLVAGLALGVTGLASATDPTPAPKTGTQSQPGPGFGPDGHRGHERRGAGGLVSAVSPSSLTLHSPEGTKTIALNASTTYYQGETAATLAAVKVGEIVHVRLVDPTAAHPVAAVVRVVPAHLAGFVTAIDGPKITLIDGSGFTRTLTTSSATTYDKDGATGSASDIKVGGFIHAAGTVDPDGTTLDATKVGTGRPHPFGPGQGHGPEQGPEQGPGPDGGPGA